MKNFLLTFLILAAGTLNLKAQITGLSGWNIFIDPGHSQNENVGIYGYSEAHKVLRVGLALQSYLLNETDIDTAYLSRTNDQQVVSLTQRTDKANSLAAAWYHSIHSDASSTASTNSTLLLHGGWRENGQTVEKTPHGGKAMSEIMVDILSRGYRIPTRGDYADRTFYQGFPFNHDYHYPYLHVNRESTMPSELSEAGFHTNPTQNQRNMNADWKKLEAHTLFWTILKYHNIPRPPVRILNGIISDMESGIPINGAVAYVDTQSYTTDTYESLFHLYSTNSTQLHNGFYYFENLPSDTLELIVTAPNYYPDTSQVVISDTFFTFKDVQLISTLSPTVISSSPSENDSIYPGKDNILFTFNRKMNRDSVEANLKITPNANLNFSWSNSDKTLKILSDSLEYSTNYTIKILPGATDLYGDLFDGNGDGTGGDTLILNFRTKHLDEDPPIILSVYPNELDSVELNPILRINFDETISVSGVSLLLKLIKVSDQSSIAGTIKHYVVNGKSVLHFFPSSKLSPSHSYQLKILAGIKDLLGNATTKDTVIQFKTGTVDYDITNIDNFDADLLTNWWQPSTSGSTVGIISNETNVSENTSITDLLSNSSKSMQLNYGWDLGASSWLIREYLNTGSPRNITFDKSYIMQVYIFGDGSNNKFRFAVDDNRPVDAGANHEVSPWFTIDWTGWKLVSWDMTNDGTGTWIGDGSLDGTLRIDSFQMTYAESTGAPSGMILFDDLSLAKKVIVGVDKNTNASTIPTSFELYQNYPNPFNPSTVIQYQIPKESFVSVKIYDILGKEIAALVNEQKSAGIYRINFDAAKYHLSSGTYFYKLTAGDFNKTNKFVLLK
jgi:N-acetylmuramoyl-L-alanine amidase